MVRQVKLKVYQNNTAKAKSRKLKQPVIRNKNFALMQDTIIKNISTSRQQQQLEEAIINKDFEAYNKLTKGFKDQDKRIHIDNILRAITLLKSGFNNARMTVQEYDPTNEIVEDVEKEADTLLNTLDKRFNELIQMRPRINRLSETEERRFNTIDREIERYSIDFEKINGLVKKLEGKEKLTKDEIDDIKDKKQVILLENQFLKDLNNIFKFGYDNSNKEISEISNQISNSTNKQQIYDAMTNFVKNYLNKYTKKALELKKILGNVIAKGSVVNKKRGTIGQKSQGGINVAQIDDINNKFKAFDTGLQNLYRSFDKPKVANMQDLKYYSNIGDTFDTFIKEGKDIEDQYTNILAAINLKVDTLDTLLLDFNNMIDDLKIYRQAINKRRNELNDLLFGNNKIPTGGNKKVDNTVTFNKVDYYTYKRNFNGSRLQYITDTNRGNIKAGSVIDVKKQDHPRNVAKAFMIFSNKTIIDIEQNLNKLIRYLKNYKKSLKKGSVEGVQAEIIRDIEDEKDPNTTEDYNMYTIETDVEQIETIVEYLKNFEKKQKQNVLPKPVSIPAQNKPKTVNTPIPKTVNTPFKIPVNPNLPATQPKTSGSQNRKKKKKRNTPSRKIN